MYKLIFLLSLLSLTNNSFAQKGNIFYNDELKYINESYPSQAIYKIASSDSLFWAYDGEYWGVIDKNAKIIVPFDYQVRQVFDFILSAGQSQMKESNLIALKNKEGKWGVINYLGKISLPFEYDFVYAEKANMTENYQWQYDFWVEKDGKTSLIKYDKEKDELPYKHFGGTGYSDVFWFTNDGKQYVLYDKVMKNEFPLEDLEKAFSDNKMQLEKIVYIVQHNGKYRLINIKGKVISADYDYIFQDYYCPSIYTYKNGKKGLMNFDGTEIEPCQYSDIKYTWQFPSDFCIAYKKNPKEHWFFKTKTENKKYKKLSIKAEDIDFYCQNDSDDPYSLPIKQNGKWGAIDFEGNYILKPQYDEAFTLNLKNKDWYYPLKKDGKYYYTNAKEELLLNMAFDKAFGFQENRNKKEIKAQIEKDGKKGFIYLNAEIIWD